MPARGTLRRMLYLYTGVTSAVLLLVVIVMWIATSNFALVWKRVDQISVLPNSGRYSYSDTNDKYIIIGDGGLAIRFRNNRYPTEVFNGGDSTGSLYWYSDDGDRWALRLPRWNAFAFRYRDRSNFVAELPLWSIAIPLSILPVIQLIQLLRWRRRQREIRLNKLCPDCGYDCRATPDRCPECGKVLRASAMIDTSALESVVDDEEPRNDSDDARAPQS